MRDRIRVCEAHICVSHTMCDAQMWAAHLVDAAFRIRSDKIKIKATDMAAI